MEGAGTRQLRLPDYAGWLLIGALACLAYAAFANGSSTIPEESRLQVAIAAGVLAAGLGLAAGALVPARSPLAWTGVGVLAGFALYSALSVGWSIAPDEGWLASNRAFAYAAFAAIVLLAAPSVRRAPELALAGFVVIGLAVALYALGGKLFPTVSIGPIDLDHASLLARLRSPLGYWNALGLLLVMATPACIWIAADRSRRPRLRIAALLSLQVLLVAIALTLSRGSLVAFAVAVAVMVAAGPDRQRRLGVAALGALAAAPAVAYAFSVDQLSVSGIPADERSGEGLILFAILVVSAIALAGVAKLALGAEQRVAWSEERTGRLWRALAALAVVGALAGTVGLAASDRGLTGSVSHAWERFKAPTVQNSFDPARLVSGTGSNRWTWWSEGAGAWSERPIAGWGAGSFPLLHDRYREQATQVRSVHDVPLQMLAEGGLIGAGLAIAAVALLGAAAVSTTRSATGADRAARVALLAAAAAWAVHTLYDWDWEIPAVTLPALGALALAAVPRPDGNGAGPEKREWGVPVAVAAAVLAVVMASSAALPAIAEDKRLQAQRDASEAEADTARVEDAAAEALFAHKLNPLDESALFVAADLQTRLGDFAHARELVLDAARLQPDNFRVWDRVIELAGASGDPLLLATATRRRIETEPLTFAAEPGKTAGLLYTVEVPAQLSPTAVGTPPP